MKEDATSTEDRKLADSLIRSLGEKSEEELEEDKKEKDKMKKFFFDHRDDWFGY